MAVGREEVWVEALEVEWEMSHTIFDIHVRRLMSDDWPQYNQK